MDFRPIITWWRIYSRTLATILAVCLAGNPVLASGDSESLISDQAKSFPTWFIAQALVVPSRFSGNNVIEKGDGSVFRTTLPTSSNNRAAQDDQQPQVVFQLGHLNQYGETGGNIANGFSPTEIEALLQRATPVPSYNLDELRKTALIAIAAALYGNQNLRRISLDPDKPEQAYAGQLKAHLQKRPHYLLPGIDLSARLRVPNSEGGSEELGTFQEYWINAVDFILAAPIQTFAPSVPAESLYDLSPLAVQGAERYFLEAGRPQADPHYGIFLVDAFNQYGDQLSEHVGEVIAHAALEAVTPKGHSSEESLAIHKTIYQQMQDPIFSRGSDEESNIKLALRGYINRQLKKDFNGGVRKDLIRLVREPNARGRVWGFLKDQQQARTGLPALNSNEIDFLEKWNQSLDLSQAKGLEFSLLPLQGIEIKGFREPAVLKLSKVHSDSGLWQVYREANYCGIGLIIQTGDPVVDDDAFWGQHKLFRLSPESVKAQKLMAADRARFLMATAPLRAERERKEKLWTVRQARSAVVAKLIDALHTGSLTQEMDQNRRKYIWTQTDVAATKPEVLAQAESGIGDALSAASEQVRESWNAEVYVAAAIKHLQYSVGFELPEETASQLAAKIRGRWLSELLGAKTKGTLTKDHAWELFRRWSNFTYALLYTPLAGVRDKDIYGVEKALHDMRQWDADSFIVNVKAALGTYELPPSEVLPGVKTLSRSA